MSHPTLGAILRDLRNHRGWTLKEMSEKSGIPVSTLSKVEHDRLTLTYDKLLQLSQKLQIRMSELFAEGEAAGEGVTARRSIGRQDDSVRVTTPNYDYYYLCTELRRKRMIPVLTRIRAKSLGEFGDLVRHSGEEYVHVLEGSIETQVPRPQLFLALTQQPVLFFKAGAQVFAHRDVLMRADQAAIGHRSAQDRDRASVGQAHDLRYFIAKSGNTVADEFLRIEMIV